jgi:hypothetical protein
MRLQCGLRFSFLIVILCRIFGGNWRNEEKDFGGFSLNLENQTL